MSAVLNRTWNFLSSNLSSALSLGPRWTVPDQEAGPAAHLPIGLASFLHNLYLCDTRQEEAQLVHQTLDVLENRLRDSSVKPAVIAEGIVKALACHILGYDVQFIYIHALQLAQKGSILEKKMGYLACNLLLKGTDDLMLLLTNTIIKDLESQNVIEINMALTAVAYLTPIEMAPLILPILIKKLSHSKDFIRKKALICIQQLIKENAPLGSQMESRICQCLTDSDPGVVSVSVQVLRTIVESKETTDLKIIPSLLAILKQIMDKKLPTEYLCKSISAPWFQMDLLQTISLIISKSKWNPNLYEHISSMLMALMEQTTIKETCGQAIIAECIKLVSTMNKFESDKSINTKCLQYIHRFLQSKHNNVKYTGLSCLEKILKHSPSKFEASEEENILNCLTHPDKSIQNKTLSLMYSLANKNNVRKICDKLLEYIELSESEFQREDLIQKSLNLSESFSLGLDWKMSLLLKLLQKSKGDQREILMAKIKAYIYLNDEDNADVRNEKILVIKKFQNILEKMSHSENPPPPAMRLYVWLLSQNSLQKEESSNVIELVNEIARIGFLAKSMPLDYRRLVLLSCLESIFLLIEYLEESSQEVIDFLQDCSNENEIPTVVDNAAELHMIMKNLQFIKKNCKNAQSNVDEDFTLSYLDHIVVDKLENHLDRPYLIKSKITKSLESSDMRTLRITPYQVLEENERWKNTDTVDSNDSTPQSEVWTYDGILVKDDKDDDDDVEKEIKTLDSAVNEKLEDSILGLNTEGWN